MIRCMEKKMSEKKLEPVALNRIEISDTFWNKYTKLVTEQIIPYQWEVLNDRIPDAEPSHCIENFQIAAGLKEGTFHGWVFQDTDLAKWLEAVAYSLSYEKNDKLEKMADEAVKLMEAAQQPDGYLNTHFTILMPEKRFCNLKEGHELYTAGHFMEAAVAYYQVTGKKRFLDVMCRYADYICQVFHTEKYKMAVPGHQEVEIGLVRLYQVTGERKYLEMAKDFIDRRGCEPNYLVHEHEQAEYVDIFHDPNPFLPEYSQCHKPVRQQETAEGHAVRAVYMYCAMADLAYEYQEKSLLNACEKLYDNIVQKRMYLTGGIGSSGAYERFTTDYDLPNESGYSESCASIGLALFCRRMAQITRKSKYADTMERALMNTVLAGIAMDGKSFFYVNPLEVWPENCLDHTSMAHVKPVRQKWFGCACCPPNIARTLASLGEYVYMQGEEGLWVNLFVGGTAELKWRDSSVKIAQRTRFPFEGNVWIEVEAQQEIEHDLYIRIPEYAKEYTILINGEQVTYTVEKGYARVHRLWKKDIVEIQFEMKAHFVYANTEVRADAGKTAIMKGPLVYCLEEEDNGRNLSSVYVDTTAPIREVYDENLLGGTMTCLVKGKKMRTFEFQDKKLYGSQPAPLEEAEWRLVPYCYWGNRRNGEMQVWMKYLV